MPLFGYYLLLLPPAALLAYDDFRMRQVSIAWLAVLGFMTLIIGSVTAGVGAMLLQTTINAGLLLLFGVVMISYHRLRGGSRRDFFRRSFGTGDVVMMLAVAPLFAPTVYVRFLLAANLAALGWWVVKRPATIPLAGFIALMLGAYTLYKTAVLWT